MRASRLMAILLRLQAQGRVSAPALAAVFEVSVRTIYRDIDALSAAGVPVYAETGRGGGFALHGGYRTPLTGLDRPEAEALFLAGVPFAAAQLGREAALESMRLKLLAALPDATRRDAERVAARFHVDPVGWFRGPDAEARLPALAAAVWAGRWVRMRYERWQGEVERRAAPLGLVLKAGLWYLVAAVDGQPRTYRVASIRELVVEDEAAPPPPARFDLRRHWAAFTRDYEARMQAERATVRARPEALRRLAELSDAVATAVAAAGPPRRDGWHVVEIPIESVAAATGELLKLGPGVQALAPPALRRALKAAAAELLAVYGRRQR